MQEGILRILDANMNRSREALRVLEESARFVLNDARLSEQAKSLRHQLSRCSADWDHSELLSARDTIGDVGTGIGTEAEYQRKDSTGVLQAACKRLAEGLRCLEEYGKVVSETSARGFEQLRYQCYEFEKALFHSLAVGQRVRAVRVYVLLSREFCREPMVTVARELLENGADCLQLREKAMPEGQLLALAEQLAELCHEHEALLLVNDRPDIARLSGSDGVHVGQDDLPPGKVKQLIGINRIVGKSTHDPDEFRAAMSEPCDYLAVGAIFASGTKPGVAVAGPAFLKWARSESDVPLFAIGGITPERVGEVMAAGATGVAVCQSVLQAKRPGTAVAELREAIDRSSGPPNGRSV